MHGNLISGNGVAEVYVWDFGTDFNVLTGNYIGTNLAGTAPLPNLTSTGIATGGAAYTRIGGQIQGEGNVVVNPGGVSVHAPFCANTLMLGNHIGLNAARTAVLAGAGGLRLSGKRALLSAASSRRKPITSPLTGTGFYACDSVVRWDGLSLPTTVLSSTLAQVVVAHFFCSRMAAIFLSRSLHRRLAAANLVR